MRPSRSTTGVRPTYPSGVCRALFARLPEAPSIVEVGPGTGQATRDLLARGASVHAIEIGPAMAARLRANLPSPRLQVSVGDFEAMSVPGTIDRARADALFSATAYHWISRTAQTDRPTCVCVTSTGTRPTAPPSTATYCCPTPTQLMPRSDRRGLLDDIDAFIRRDFGGSVTRPIVVALTTAVLVG
ncbi:MAG: class I SAM-dependent methyltransferase [Propionibacteriaceae bacterium]